MNFKTFKKSIEEICKNNNFVLSDELKDDSYVASIMDSDDSKNNILNLLVYEDKIETYVTTYDGDEIEKFVKDDDFNHDEGLEFVMDSIDSFKVLSGIDPDNIEKDDNGNPILNEDDNHEDIVSKLDKIKMNIKSSADNLVDLSKLSSNIEIISIIMDLANNAYSFVLDIESAIDSYYEIQEQDLEDSKEEREDIQDEIDESKERINIAKSKLSMKNLVKKGIVSESEFNEYSQIMDKIFS